MSKDIDISLKDLDVDPTLNREGWLMRLAESLHPVFRGFKVKDQYRITCGWPHKNATSNGKTLRLGECHSPKTSTDGKHELFITPLIDDPLRVAGVVAHELAHVAAGVEAAHGKGFKRVCDHVGLTHGKPTSAMPGDSLNRTLARIIYDIGAYPHKAIKPIPKGMVKKTSSSVRCECVKCGCRLTLSDKWYKTSGLPVCGCGGVTSLLSSEDE